MYTCLWWIALTDILSNFIGQSKPPASLSKSPGVLQQWLSHNHQTTYAAGQQRFTSFCDATKIPPLPASEATLILFATHLATQNISHSTIKVYLLAVRHMHISVGLHNFFNTQLTPRLQLTIKGIQKSQASAQPSRVRLPITLKIMGTLRLYYLSSHTPTPA